MVRAASAVAASILGSAIVVASAAPALAAPACDVYSNNCVQVGGEKFVQQPPSVTVQSNADTLPFTGGEIVLMTLVGGGALGAGVVLVRVGRRRREAQA